MSNVLRSWSDWRVVLVIGTLAFTFFLAATLAIASVADQPTDRSLSVHAIRLALGMVVGAAMLLLERRRDRPSVDAAIKDGLVIAALLVVINNAFGTTESGPQLGLRTGFIVVGLPLLMVLTHLLVRRARVPQPSVH